MAIDWARVSDGLDARGAVVLSNLVSRKECESLAMLYADESRFRSRVVMARHGFGRGEYQYFHYPLPEPLAGLRRALYPPLAEVANRWHEAMGIEVRFPCTHEKFLKRCHAAGQRKRPAATSPAANSSSPSSGRGCSRVRWSCRSRRTTRCSSRFHDAH